MSSSLILPDGVRLPRRREIPGPRADRDRIWAQVEQASFRPGFVVRGSESPEFAFFLEVNVDAPKLWAVFCAVVSTLLAEGRASPTDPGRVVSRGGTNDCQLLLADSDSELEVVASAPWKRILAELAEVQYPLVHDGFLHFGIVRQSETQVVGALVTPTKHLQVWAQTRDEPAETLRAHGLEEFGDLAFLASYPVMCETPDDVPVEFESAKDLHSMLAERLAS